MSGRGEFLVTAGTVLSGFGPKDNLDGVPDAAILVRDGIIAQNGSLDALTAAHPGLPTRGGPEMIAIPGFVNSHHHFGITPRDYRADQQLVTVAFIPF